jgi:hypothetical protein
MWRDLAEDLICLSPLFGVLQNDTAPLIIGNPPFFDLIQGTKAAEAGKVVVQATIPYARGLSGTADVTHEVGPNCEALNLTTQAQGNPRNASQ